MTDFKTLEEVQAACERLSSDSFQDALRLKGWSFTADQLRIVLSALTQSQARNAELEASQHHFKDADWPLALQRLKHMEPGQDGQGIAIVGTDDLEFALERLAHFAQVAMGNAAEVGRLEARIAELEGALTDAGFVLGVTETCLKSWNGTGSWMDVEGVIARIDALLTPSDGESK